MAKVLVVGGGGREMAQAVTLAASPQVAQVFCAPGNGGTEQASAKISNVAIKDSAIDELVAFSTIAVLRQVSPPSRLSPCCAALSLAD